LRISTSSPTPTGSPKNYEENFTTIKASVSAYSPHETCRPDYCITACGTSPQAKQTIACPRRLACGTKVQIAGQDYICEDRTARWIEEMYGGVFDIFMEDYNAAIQFGRQTLEVKIYK